MTNNENFNRTKYLRNLVHQMINKSRPETITSIYNFYKQVIEHDINNNNKEINSEKIKILENCYRIFSKPEIRKAIAERRANTKLDTNALVELVLNIISEKVLGDRKRTYNMSDKYSEESIATQTNKHGESQKMIHFTPINKPLSINLVDDHGHEFSITKTGTLFYNDGIIEESIDQFRITKKTNDNQFENYEIFSQIDFSKLKEDKTYKQVVLQELLSQNNIELSNAGGYIGEIVNAKAQHNNLKVGEQRNNPHGFYTYQISSNYALVYDALPLTAVMSYMKSKNQERPESSSSTSEGR